MSDTFSTDFYRPTTVKVLSCLSVYTDDNLDILAWKSFNTYKKTSRFSVDELRQ